MNRDQALAKIKKCLALSKSPNANEAAAAMRQAQKLMQAYGVDEQDIELSSVSHEQCRTVMSAATRWESALANLVADAFGCEVLWARNIISQGGLPRLRLHVVFYGLGAAPKVAQYAWQVLSRKCAAQRLEHIRAQPASCKPITKTARGDAFAIGWVTGVRNNVATFAGQRHPELLEAYRQHHWPSTAEFTPKDRTVSRNVRTSSFTEGHRAGSEVKLNHGVEVSTPHQLEHAA